MYADDNDSMVICQKYFNFSFIDWKIGKIFFLTYTYTYALTDLKGFSETCICIYPAPICAYSLYK